MMHHKRKEAAVKRFSSILGTGQSRTEAVAQLKEEYEGTEIDEILASFDAIETAVKTTFNKDYEEWRVEVRFDNETKRNTVDKIKVLRTNVKITEDEAEVLNTGARATVGNNQIMYFLKETAIA
jgi:uncharacterized phage-like protein YoqJ